jgi:hypothetical protein
MERGGDDTTIPLSLIVHFHPVSLSSLMRRSQANLAFFTVLDGHFLNTTTLRTVQCVQSSVSNPAMRLHWACDGGSSFRPDDQSATPSLYAYDAGATLHGGRKTRTVVAFLRIRVTCTRMTKEVKRNEVC